MVLMELVPVQREDLDDQELGVEKSLEPQRKNLFQEAQEKTWRSLPLLLHWRPEESFRFVPETCHRRLRQ